MQLAPRYGSDPVLVLDFPLESVVAPAARQRRRLANMLAGFTDEQWAHPSRCAGWSNHDVVSHLDSTNGFWNLSIGAGLRGDPTSFLATFDPVTTPAQLAAASTASNAELLAQFVASSEAFASLLESLDDAGLATAAEAPPGHVSISAVAHHALWDAWVHERDILLPMGMAPIEDADEIASCLRYGAALGPALARNRGVVQQGVLALDLADPAVQVVVEIGDRVVVRAELTDHDADLCLTGSAVDVLESLSIRRPLDQAVPASCTWMLSGLSETFDNPSS